MRLADGKYLSAEKPDGPVHLGAQHARMRFYTILACSGRAVSSYYRVTDDREVTCRACKTQLGKGRIMVAEGVTV